MPQSISVLITAWIAEIGAGMKSQKSYPKFLGGSCIHNYWHTWVNEHWPLWNSVHLILAPRGFVLIYQISCLLLLIASVVHAAIPKYPALALQGVRWFGKNPNQFMQRLCKLVENNLQRLSIDFVWTFTLRRLPAYISVCMYVHVHIYNTYMQLH